jgi:ATP adenylyltransferase
MDHLWSPWRLDYVTGKKPDAGCVFCDAIRPPSPDSLIVDEGTTCFVILNLYPYNNGHLMVVPHRHVDRLAALPLEELQEVALLTQRSEIALYQAYAVPGINIGINLGQAAGAGIHDHLHVHLVPRWTGDTNFMTTVARTRVLPEDLPTTAARLRPVFARLAGKTSPTPNS